MIVHSEIDIHIRIYKAQSKYLYVALHLQIKVGNDKHYIKQTQQPIMGRDPDLFVC